jgi:Tfp pilus assembly protein PilE
MLGVTLLEIMLVLAVAALIIVMSIRFYQSASNSSKVNNAMSIIQAITAAEENYFNASGVYDTSGSKITGYLPANQMPVSPWSGTVTVKTGTSPAVYAISMENVPGGGTASNPTGTCGQLAALVQQNSSKYSSAACSGTTFSVDVLP